MRILLSVAVALILCGHASAQTGNPAADIRMNTIEIDAQRRLEEQRRQIEEQSRRMQDQQKQMDDQQRQLDEMRQRMPYPRN